MRELTDYEKIIDMLIESDTKHEIENPRAKEWHIIINPNTKNPVTMVFKEPALVLEHIEG